MARRPSKYKGYLFETDTDVPRTTQFKRKHLNADVEEIPDEPNEEVIYEKLLFYIYKTRQSLASNYLNLKIIIKFINDIPV